MKKLRLDDLAVDSFVTSSGVAVGGTVKGFSGDNCYTNTNSVYSACPTCGSGGAGCTDQTAAADCGGGEPSNLCTQHGYTCGAEGTCAPGATNCGTCWYQASCDLQHGCGGTSYDLQMC